MEAQNAIHSAQILLITMKALGNEIAKNLVLAGINSLSISDLSLVSAEDLGAQFFLTEEDVGRQRAEAALPRIQKLNKRVNVSILPVDPLTSADTSYLAPFTTVIATDLPFSLLKTLNAACRISNKPFYCAGSHGLYGYMFADLIMHSFSIEREPSNNPVKPGSAETTTRSIIGVTRVKDTDKVKELVTKQEIYQPLLLANQAPLPAAIKASSRRMRAVPSMLPCLRALWEFEAAHNDAGVQVDEPEHLKEFTALATNKSRELQLPLDHLKSEFLRTFLANAYLELAPTSAFLGAALAQDVINVLGGREQPCQNFVLFDGEDGRAECLALVPEVSTQDVGL